MSPQGLHRLITPEPDLVFWSNPHDTSTAILDDATEPLVEAATACHAWALLL